MPPCFYFFLKKISTVKDNSGWFAFDKLSIEYIYSNFIENSDACFQENAILHHSVFIKGKMSSVMSRHCICRTLSYCPDCIVFRWSHALFPLIWSPIVILLCDPPIVSCFWVITYHLHIMRLKHNKEIPLKTQQTLHSLPAGCLFWIFWKENIISDINLLLWCPDSVMISFPFWSNWVMPFYYYIIIT